MALEADYLLSSGRRTSETDRGMNSFGSGIAETNHFCAWNELCN
jgi:hypothetical protein